jgi:hypothetical protein
MARHLDVDPVNVRWAVNRLVELGLVAIKPGAGGRANTYFAVPAAASASRCGRRKSDPAPIASLHTIRVATSGEYRFEFAFICSHPSPAFQNVSLHGIGAPTTCFHVITSVFGVL